MTTPAGSATRLLLATVILCLGLPALAAQSPVPDQALDQKLREIHAKINARLPANSYGVALPTAETPGQVLDFVTDIGKLIQPVEGQDPARPLFAKVGILDALMLLYKGRGNTSPKDGKGWFPANSRGPTGLAEISQILKAGLLDEQGLEQFAGFVKSHDFNVDSSKTLQGFPPKLAIGTAEFKSAVLKEIEHAPRGAAFETRPATEGEVSTVAELIVMAQASGDLDGGTAGEIAAFLSSLENNLYDKSVLTLRDPAQPFVAYFGREKEVQDLVDIFTKMEKMHVLVTGKAGVGKTTIFKILSDAFVQGRASILDGAPPIILELPITMVTNPNDPSEIKKTVALARRLSKAIDRRIILYVDEAHVATPMTRNALKGVLTEAVREIPKSERVHVAFATTSGEARQASQDTAYNRRFSALHVPELNDEDTIALIRQAHLPQWKKHHIKNGYALGDITDEAFEYALRYGSIEQPHAGNPTGAKELLEAAIALKLNREAARGSKGAFTLEAEDLRRYIQDRLRMPLVPGDPEFDAKFSERFDRFEKSYAGNEGAKAELRQIFYRHFGNLKRKKMTAITAFGPPGGGKSYAPELLAEIFFDGALLVLPAADYKTGGISVNKLIGSPTGTAGAEQQRSILTQFISDHPNGGFVVWEESDSLHQDIVQLRTNMITSGKLIDGLGKEWDASRIVFWDNSNFGQELMIPIDSRNKMDWVQYDIRRKAMTETSLVNGKPVETVRKDQLDGIFDRYMQQIVTQSIHGGDTSAVSQEANKQKRRYKRIYILPPNKQELQAGARLVAARIQADLKADYGIALVLDEALLDGLLDLDHYEFEKGHSYVSERLDHITEALTPHFHKRGTAITLTLEDTTVQLAGRQLPARNLIVSIAPLAGKPAERHVHALGVTSPVRSNPWGDNPDMMARIKSFTSEMSKHAKGNVQHLMEIKELLKAKAVDWSSPVVLTRLGTPDSGGTSEGKAVGRVLFGDESAAFTISGITDKYRLADYFRPPSGFKEGVQETEFERWLKSRQASGGGVIVLDGLLSFDGLSPRAVSERMEAINQLKELLAHGVARFGNKSYDARGFVIYVTGNVLQNVPADEVTRKQVVEALGQYGVDSSMVSWLGQIVVQGPRPRAASYEDGQKRIEEAATRIAAQFPQPVKIDVAPDAVRSIVDSLGTEAEEGFQKLIIGPLSAIVLDIPDAREIRLRLEGGRLLWSVNGQEVALEGKAVEGSPGLEEKDWAYKARFGKLSQDRTPQLGGSCLSLLEGNAGP